MSDRKSGFCFPYMVKKTADKGLGVFAGETIKQGSIVWRNVPDQYTVYDEKSFKAAIENMAHADVVYELTHVFGLEDLPGCLIRILDDAVLINHSNNANLATNIARKNKAPLDLRSAHYVQDVTKALLDVRYALVATRDIENGEEFTNDYAAEVVDPPFYHELCAHYGVREEYLGGR